MFGHIFNPFNYCFLLLPASFILNNIIRLPTGNKFSINTCMLINFTCCSEFKYFPMNSRGIVSWHGNTECTCAGQLRLLIWLWPLCLCSPIILRLQVIVGHVLYGRLSRTLAHSGGYQFCLEYQHVLWQYTVTMHHRHCLRSWLYMAWYLCGIQNNSAVYARWECRLEAAIFIRRVRWMVLEVSYIWHPQVA